MTMRHTERADPAFTHEGYRSLLSTALESGYSFVDYDTAMASVRQSESKLLCVLRHDCDNDLVAAHFQAMIEAELGIMSTYFIFLRSAFYNPFSQPNRQLLNDIISKGHRLGLHFDEHAYPGLDDDAMAKRVEIEREWMSREYGAPVDAVSFHQPTSRVLENLIKIDCTNTYDREDMAGIFYISDSNKGWKNQSPSDLFHNRTHQRIQILVHPEWWTPKPVTVLENWRQMYRHQFMLAQDQALVRELSYDERQLLLFETEGDAV